MDELKEIIDVIWNAIREPDVIILGAMFVVGVMGFVCGWALCEIIAIKHQILNHRYHTRRRDPYD